MSKVVYKGRLKSRIPDIIDKLEPNVDRALLEGAAIVEAQAKALVPKKTGTLERAIHTERRYDRGRVLTFVVAWSREGFYGHFVEHGHKERGGGWVPAHPFMVPAAEAARPAINRLTWGAVRNACE